MNSEETKITSKAELKAELQALLISGFQNGIDVEGAYGCRNEIGQPDWDMVVTEVEKNDSSK